MPAPKPKPNPPPSLAPILLPPTTPTTPPKATRGQPAAGSGGRGGPSGGFTGFRAGGGRSAEDINAEEESPFAKRGPRRRGGAFAGSMDRRSALARSNKGMVHATNDDLDIEAYIADLSEELQEALEFAFYGPHFEGDEHDFPLDFEAEERSDLASPVSRAVGAIGATVERRTRPPPAARPTAAHDAPAPPSHQHVLELVSGRQLLGYVREDPTLRLEPGPGQRGVGAGEGEAEDASCFSPLQLVWRDKVIAYAGWETTGQLDRFHVYGKSWLHGPAASSDDADEDDAKPGKEGE